MRPLRIWINDLFKYGSDNNEFTFKPNQLALIVGPNGSGKSSIFEAVCFALFGRTIRWGATKEEIIRRGAEGGSATLLFEHGGQEYEVTRTRHSRLAGDVQFSCVDTGEKFGKGLKETDKEIIDLLGFGFEEFRNSVLFGQHDLTKIVSLRSAERLELLTNFLGLSILDKCLLVAKERTVETKERMKGIDADLHLRDKPRLRKKLTKLRGTFKETKSTLKEAEEKFSNINELVKKLDRLQTSSAKASNAIKDTQSDIDEIIKRKSKLNKLVGKKTHSIEGLQEEWNKATEERDALPVINNEIGSIENELDTINEEYIETNASCRSFRTKIGQIRKKRVCTECGREYTVEVRDALIAKVQKKLDAENTKLSKLKKKLDPRRSKLKKLQNKRERILQSVSPEAIEDKIKAAKRDDAMKGEVAELDITIAKKRMVIKRNKGILEAIKEEGYTSVRLEKLRDGLVTLSGNVAAHEERVAAIREDIKVTKTAINDATVLEEERIDLEDSLKRKGFILEMYSKTGGMRQIIIENVLPVLNAKINGYLDVLTDEGISVEFTTGSKTKDGKYKEKLDIYIASPEGIAEFASYSGGEKQTIILSIGLGISELAAESVGMNCDVLLLDEVFGSLDNKARKRLVKLLFVLQDKFSSVVAISHIPELQSQIPNIIKVKRSGGLSRIIQSGN